MSSQSQTPKKSPPIDLNDKYDKADVVGTLIVVLLKARNLKDKHSFRKSDVFAQAILNGTQKRTHVDIKGGQHPEWDGEVRFPILKKLGEKFITMEVSCYSVEPRSEDLMGKGTVNISETLRTGEFDDWVQLEVDGVPRGELYIEMTYYANSPAPTAVASNKLLSVVANQNADLTRRPSKLSPAERLSRPQPESNLPAHQLEGHVRPQAHNLRPSEGHTPIRHDTPIMPGSYPSGSSSNPSGMPHYEGDLAVPNLRPGQQQPQSADLPNILRPGLSNSLLPVPPPQRVEHGRRSSSDSSPQSDRRTPIHRLQNGIEHGRQGFTNSSFPLGNAGHTKGGSSGYNPYIGGGGDYSVNGSQPSSPPRNPYISNYVAPTNPYIAVTGISVEAQRLYNVPPSAASRAQDTYAAYRPGTQPRGGAPLLWQQENTENSSFSFPKPDVTSPYMENTHPTHHRRSSGPHAPQNMANNASVDGQNFESHLQTRYQSPLPLPPRSDYSAASAMQPQHSSSQAFEARPNSTYTKPPSPPPKTVTSTLDQSGLDALRRAEKEATRRREQELKDMELAMQLDRELNMAAEQAST